jgi:hypothetical protein
MPRKSKTGKSKTGARSRKETQRLHALKKTLRENKKNNSTTTKKTAAAAGGARRHLARSGPVDYGEVPADEFVRMFDDDGMDEEAKQRLAKMVRGDDSNSASDDNNSASEVRCFPRRIFGSSVRACCANEMMPAQEESQESEENDLDESDTSSVGAASVDSETPFTRRSAEKVAQKSNAPTAGQVWFSRATGSVDPSRRDVRCILQPLAAPATAGPAVQASDEAQEPTPAHEWPQPTHPGHGLKLKEPLENSEIDPGFGPFGWRNVSVATGGRSSQKQGYIIRIKYRRYFDVKWPIGEKGAFECAKAADKKRIELGLEAVNFDATTGEPLNKSHIGVYLTKDGKWQTIISMGGRHYQLGNYRSVEAAKKAYDQKALMYGKATNYRYV